MPTAKCIHIVGAGLVGSLLAVRLRQAGFSVKIFEKRPDVRKVVWDAGRSINLIITSRGMHSLDQAGLLDEARKRSVQVYGRMMHAQDGAQTYQPYGQERECNWSISRIELNRFLLDAAEKAGAEIFFHKDIRSVDFEKQSLQFVSQSETGVDEKFDFLFATDGSGSVLRKQFLQLQPQASCSTDWLAVDYKELTLPLPQQNVESFRAKYKPDALHIWPRGSHMMMALANLDGGFTVTLYLPKNSERADVPAFANLKTISQIKDFFFSEFPDAISDMPHYVNEFQNNPQGALGTVKLSNWTDAKSIQFMGDAAHAITPFFGQGTNLGFEDVALYMDFLKAHEYNFTETSQVFSLKQKPNADAIADMAVENWFEMSERVRDPKFLIRKKIESEIEKRFPRKFKSRYGMVTYSLIPYARVYEIGQMYDHFFGNYLKDVDPADDFSKLNWAPINDWVHSLDLKF